MLLVYFSCVDLKETLSFKKLEYVKKICTNLDEKGLVSYNIIDKNITKKDRDIEINIVNDDEFVYRFIQKGGLQKEAIATAFEIEFKFGTYNDTLLLAVYIYANTAAVSLNNNYIEKLKFSIKDFIVRDWKRIEWLVDKDSEELLISLYPEIFRVENLARPLIYEAMTLRYGPSWWEIYVPETIKNKHKARSPLYKNTISGFRNIDDTLISVDVGDLYCIFTRKMLRWNQSYDEKINAMINGMADWNDQTVKNTLCQQIEVKQDLWKEAFKDCLSNDENANSTFIDKLRVFEKNRNHIMHNKPIDRQAYEAIQGNCNELRELLEHALNKLRNTMLSDEEKVRLENEMKEQTTAFVDAYREIKETEAGVQVRNYEEISDIFRRVISILQEEVADALRFRNDLEVDNSNEGCIKIIYKIDESVFMIIVSIDINDAPGVTSELALASPDIDDFKIILEYVNGEMEFNEEQGTYIPLVQDVQPDIDKAVTGIVDYVNENFPNLRDKVDADMYEVYRHGEPSPVFEDVACEACGELYIAADDRYAARGTCLNCGEINEIHECVKCGQHYIGREENMLCDYCQDKIRRA